jgi:hypothetical protein
VTVGAGVVVAGVAGVAAVAVGVVFDFLGFHASSSKPSAGFDSDVDSVGFPFVASALGLKASSLTVSLAGFAGVGLVFLAVLSRIAPPGPLNSPPAVVGVPSYAS